MEAQSGVLFTKRTAVYFVDPEIMKPKNKNIDTVVCKHHRRTSYYVPVFWRVLFFLLIAAKREREKKN